MAARFVIPLLLLVGCEPPPPPDPAPAPVAPPTPAASDWRERDGSALVAVDDPKIVEALEAATARARTSAGRARDAWRQAPPAAKGQWVIKWAAPTDSGGVEHVWVRPRSWSAHRIEGVLANPPQRSLLCGAGAGDAVAFSTDQMSDWVRNPGDGRPREGGFTIAVLEAAFGDA